MPSNDTVISDDCLFVPDPLAPIAPIVVAEPAVIPGREAINYSYCGECTVTGQLEVFPGALIQHLRVKSQNNVLKTHPAGATITYPGIKVTVTDEFGVVSTTCERCVSPECGECVLCDISDGYLMQNKDGHFECKTCDNECGKIATYGRSLGVYRDLIPLGSGDPVPACWDESKLPFNILASKDDFSVCVAKPCNSECGECLVCDHPGRKGMWIKDKDTGEHKCIPCEVSCGMCINRYTRDGATYEVKGILVNNDQGGSCSKCVDCEVNPKIINLNLAHTDFECGGSDFCKSGEFLCPGTTNEYLPCIKTWIPYSFDNPAEWQTDPSAGYYACIPCGQCPETAPFSSGCGEDQTLCANVACPDNVNYRKYIPIRVGEGDAAYNDCLICEDCPGGGAKAEFSNQECGSGPDVDGIDLTIEDANGNPFTVFVATNGDACERYERQAISFLDGNGCSTTMTFLVEEGSTNGGIVGSNALAPLIEAALRAATVEITCDASGEMIGKIMPGNISNNCSGGGGSF